MKKTISLSGLDGSGKTTQLTKIVDYNKFVYVAKKIVDYRDFPKLKDEELARWWFFDGETENVINTIYQALYDRNEDIQKQDYPLIIANRDDNMFDATCIATIAIRNKCPLKDAEIVAGGIKMKFPFKNVFDKRIVYSSKDDLEAMIENFRARSKNHAYSKENEMIYSRYQHLLAQILKKQIERGIYTDIVNPLQPIENVFDETRKVVNKTLVEGLDLSHIDFVVGLGGLSECGKSSIGRYLMEKRGIVRIKIRNLMQDINDKYGAKISSFEEGIYGIGKEIMAALFLERLTEYFLENGHCKATIESLHNYEFTRNLKEIMGDKFKIVYIDASKEIRITRNCKNVGDDLDFSRREVERKDKKKTSRGASMIKDIADLVLDNSGTFDKTCKKLEGYLRI